MANTKSAEKRWRQSLVRRLRNRAVIGAARTRVRDTVRTIRAGEPDLDKLKAAVTALDKAAEKGIIHRNNAARRKSRLMHQFAMVAGGGALAPANRPAARRTRAGARTTRAGGARAARTKK